MKICFVCSEYPPARHGGIGTVTQTLARELVTAGHEVRVIGLSPWNDPAPEFENDRGVQVWRKKFRAAPGNWIRSRYSIFRTVKAWSREGHIELVEAPDFQGMTAGWGRLPVPVVVRLHGSSTYFAHEIQAGNRKLTFFLERAALRRADFLASCSQYTAEQTRALFGLPLGAKVIYNGTRVPDQVSREPRSPNEAVFTGTLTGKKGIVSLIRAWPAVRQQCPHAILKVLGKDGRSESGGSMKEYLIALLPKGDRNSVRFYGHVPAERLHLALRSARVAVFPSYSEAFALAPLEAMATGCPTIFTTRSSGPELIQDGENGLLIDPDRPAELAHALIRLLQDEELAKRMGAAGHRSVLQRFSLDRVLSQTAEFYSDCVHEFAKRDRKGHWGKGSKTLLRASRAAE